MNKTCFLLEEMDLLEYVGLNSNEDSDELLNEASLFGMKIDKNNLEDEEYVKELISKAKDIGKKRENLYTTLMGIGLISMLTIIGIPVGLLLIILTNICLTSGWKLEEKHLKEIDDCINKTIDKLERKKSKSKDNDEKEKIDDIIKKLKDNQENIYNKNKVQAITNLIDMSKYEDFCIKVGNEEIPCEVGRLIEFYGGSRRLLDKIKNVEEKGLEYIRRPSKSSFSYIESLSANNINTKSDLLKFMNGNKNNTSYVHNILNDEFNSYGSNVMKCLKNKKLYLVLSLEDSSVLYSYDDDCCYYWIEEDRDSIYKIETNKLLQASKTAYTDLMKLIDAV